MLVYKGLMVQHVCARCLVFLYILHPLKLPHTLLALKAFHVNVMESVNQVSFPFHRALIQQE